MNFTLNSQATFPVGTVVKAYARSNWRLSQLPPSGAPKGAAAAEATVDASGNAAFTGLEEGVRYYATAEVAGAYSYISFLASGPPATPARSKVEADALSRKGLRSKEYFSPSIPFGWNTYEGVSGTAAFTRFVPHRAMTIRGASFMVTTAAAQNDKCAIAVYDENGNRLAVSAEAAGLLNSTGRKDVEFTADLALEAEKEYWIGLQYGVPGGTVAKFSGMVFSTTAQARMISGVVPENNKFNSVITSTALPTFPFASALGLISAFATAPVLIVRER